MTGTYRRRLGLGLLAVGATLALADRFDVYTIGLAAGNRAVVLTIAAAVVVVGFWYAFDYRHVDGERWRPPDPEPGYRVPVPGEELAALRDDQLKARFRRRVIVSLIDATGCSRSEAEARLEAGTWTDDRLAASYLGDGVRVSLPRRLLARIRGESITERARRRTIAAIREVRERSGDGENPRAVQVPEKGENA